MKGENRVSNRLENVELLLAWVIPGAGLVLGIYKWVIQEHAPYFFFFTLIPPIVFGYTVVYQATRHWKLWVWRTNLSQDGFQPTIGLIWGGITQLLLFCMGNSLPFTSTFSGKLEWIIIVMFVITVFGLLNDILSMEDGFITVFNRAHYRMEGSVRSVLSYGVALYGLYSFIFSLICMVGYSFLMGPVPLSFFAWLTGMASFLLAMPFLLINYRNYQLLEQYKISKEGGEVKPVSVSLLIKYRKRIFQAVLALIGAGVVIFVAWVMEMSKRDIPDFVSPDIHLPYAQITAPGDTSLLVDLIPGKKGPFTLCPDFDARIRRYSWVPQYEEDVLTLVPNYHETVSAVSLNDQVISMTGPIKIPGDQAGREYRIGINGAEENQIAEYVVLVLPTSFLPLRVKIHNFDNVGDGFIYSGNFVVQKFRDWPMIFRDSYEEWGGEDAWAAFFNTIYTRFTVPEQATKQTDVPISE